MMASGRASGRTRHEQDLAKVPAKAVRNFDPLAPTIDERDMEREWEEGLRHTLSAAEAAFRLRRRHKAGAQFSVVEPPSPLTLALAARKMARQRAQAA